MVTNMENLHKVSCVISNTSFLAGKMEMENTNDSLSIFLTRLSNKQKSNTYNKEEQITLILKDRIVLSNCATKESLAF